MPPLQCPGGLRIAADNRRTCSSTASAGSFMRHGGRLVGMGHGSVLGPATTGMRGRQSDKADKANQNDEGHKSQAEDTA